MDKKQRASYKSIVEMINATKEIIIDLPSDRVPAFKAKVSQMRHYIGHEGRCRYKVIKEQDGVTSLHIIVGEGKSLDIEHYGIREVDGL